MPFDPSKPFDVEGGAIPEKGALPTAAAAPRSNTLTESPSSFDPNKPFDVEGESKAKPSEPAPTVGGVAGRYAAGVNTNLIASTLGAITGIPTDLANAIITNPLDPKWKAFSNPLPAEWWNQQMGKAGIGTEAAPPRNEAERIAQGAGRATGSALQTLLPAKAGIARAAAVGETAAPIAETLGAGSIPSNVAIAGASGAAGEEAEELAPENLKRAARNLGSLAGGVGAATLPAAGMGIVKAGEAAYNAIPPLRASSLAEAAPAAAVRAIETQASDPNAAFQALHDRVIADQAELVPGSKGTTPEIANDPGLLGLQNVRAVQNPELGNAITQRRADNNKARVQALQDMTAPNAAPETTQAFIKTQLQSVDIAREEAEIEATRQEAARTRDFIAPTSTPEEQGAAARGAIESERAPIEAQLTAQQQTAEKEAADTLGQFGGSEALGTPEERQSAIANYGATERGAAKAADDTERQRLAQLREAIDPSGQMGMSPDAIKGARDKILDTFPPESGTMLSGPEKHLYDTVNNWNTLIPIEQAMQLRANINGRLQNVIDHSPQEAKRLMMLKSGVDDALADTAAHIDAVERQSAQQPQVATAGGAPPAGISSRLADAIGPGLEQTQLGPKFTSDVAQAYSANPTTLRAAGRDPLARSILDQAAQAPINATEGRISTTAGAAGETPGRPENTPSSESVSPTPGERAGPTEALGVPNAPTEGGVPKQGTLEPLTPEAKDRFANWNQAYADWAKQFRGETAGQLHSVGKILQRGGAYDTYKLTDEQVPWAIFGKGPTSGDAAKRFLDATENSPEAHQAFDDAAAFSLRSAAQNPETGALNLTAYRKWMKDHDAALVQRPELLEQFNTAAKAHQKLQEVNQSLADHVATHPLRPGLGDSEILPQFWKAGPMGRDAMQKFFQMTSGQDAVAAAVDHAAFSFANDAIRNGEIVPGLADTWLRKYDQALSTMPGLKEHFANAKEAQELVDQAVSMHLQARKDFTKSMAGAFIQDDPDKAISEMFKGDNRTQKAQALMDQVKGDKGATEGIQRAAIDHILSAPGLSGPAIAGSETRTLTPDAMQKFIAANRPVLEVLFPDGLSKNFDVLAEDLKQSQRAAGAKQPIGSNTKELMERGKPFEEKKETSAGSLIMALFAEHAGQFLTGMPGVGTVAGGATLVGRPWLKGKANELRMETSKIMDQMILDPEFALQMRRLYPPGSSVPRQGVLNLLGKRTTQQALIAAQGNDLTPSPASHASGGEVVVRRFRAGGSVVNEDPHGFAEYRGSDPDRSAQHLAGIAQSIHDDDQKASEAAAAQQAKLASMAQSAERVVP